MNADNLSCAECPVLKNEIEPMVCYLHRLRAQKPGFRDDVPLMSLV